MKAFGTLLTSPGGSTFAIALGVCSMLSIAMLDPSESAAILRRQVVGSLLLVLPAIAQKLKPQHDS
jgi:hypothetical protein